MIALQPIRQTLAKARFALARKAEWLLTTERGHEVLTLVVVFALPWVMFA